MIAPTFVDLQGFIIGRNFVVKEVAILRNGFVLSHYFFASPVPWRALTKSERCQASWLIGHHHGLQWEDGNVPYSFARRLITRAVMGAAEEENGASPIVYVKGHEKQEWLADILDDDARNDVIIETLDADYEDITSLNKLDVTNTMRCEKHLKNCYQYTNDIKIPGFLNFEHRRLVRTLRRHEREFREDAWEDNGPDGLYLDLRRLFGLESYE
ncbi:uncharacterized protein LOC115236641 [Formica exsecta]|uniref:uncharacterized protein LOC115236641 n=1 Tax=Formica exsecta TaxID=72781 RepID=UPI001142BF8E|nr:uncharacterized protein LOC115236641 [Formica exsecta]